MKRINVYLAGDSTVANYESANSPQAGWGQLLPHFFSKEVSIWNKAVNGRSSKSFIDEGRLSTIAKQLKRNDYLFIQFGHNDSKPEKVRRTDPYTTYQEHLLKYIETARTNDAVPILVTPIQRRKFNPDGSINETHGEYPGAMRQIASDYGVHLIDLTEQSTRLLHNLGAENSKKLFMWIDRNVSPNFPEGAQDDTHLNFDGAKEVAELIAISVAGLPTRLADYVQLPHQKSNCEK
ncbi:rhamnogalacturonan acetylesterase [Halobacillus andaensis]|uniref:rhamnogalacturonan acetylesterase n=1 Tax=Halobacillus andaensis TaxID=1176239 RepID=UPI003D738BD2